MQEQLETAQHWRVKERLHALGLADESLSKVWMYFRLSQHWTWITIGQYEHIARNVAEIGRLLGGC